MHTPCTGLFPTSLAAHRSRHRHDTWERRTQYHTLSMLFSPPCCDSLLCAAPLGAHCSPAARRSRSLVPPLPFQGGQCDVCNPPNKWQAEQDWSSWVSRQPSLPPPTPPPSLHAHTHTTSPCRCVTAQRRLVRKMRWGQGAAESIKFSRRVLVATGCSRNGDLEIACGNERTAPE